MPGWAGVLGTERWQGDEDDLWGTPGNWQGNQVPTASNKAFTLIEMLVVIAIIMILVALLTPAMRTARARALASVCQSNLGQISTGLHGYLADHDDVTPPYQQRYTVRRSARLEDGVRYNNVRRMWVHTEWFKSGPYKGGVKDGDGFLADYLETFAETKANLMGCPAVHGELGFGSFSGIAYGPGVFEHERALGINLDATAWRFDSGQGGVGRKFHELERPSQFIFFTDTLGYSSAALAIHHAPAFTNPEDFANATPTPRHLGRWNGAFIDGHVTACKLSEFWTPPYFIRDR